MKLQHFTHKKLAADQPVALLVHDLTLELFLSCNGKHEKHKKKDTGRMRRQDQETCCTADILAPQRCNGALWMEWNSHKFVADGPGTGPVR